MFGPKQQIFRLDVPVDQCPVVQIAHGLGYVPYCSRKSFCGCGAAFGTF